MSFFNNLLNLSNPSAPPAVTIKTLTGLISYYEAESESGADGTLMNTWTDFKGNNTFPTATAKPTLKRSIVNGRAVVRFAGSQFFVTNSPVGLPAAGAPFTEFLVFSIPSTIHRSIISWGASSGAAGSRGGMFITSGNFVAFEGASNDCLGNFVCPTNTFMIVSATYAGGAIGTNYKQYHNGLAETMGSNASATLSTPVQFAIGAMSFNGSFNFIGDIALYALVSGALTTANRRACEAELSAKFNIPVV